VCAQFIGSVFACRLYFDYCSCELLLSISGGLRQYAGCVIGFPWLCWQWLLCPVACSTCAGNTEGPGTEEAVIGRDLTEEIRRMVVMLRAVLCMCQAAINRHLVLRGAAW
jgi:hypothetical protein